MKTLQKKKKKKNVNAVLFSMTELFVEKKKGLLKAPVKYINTVRK